MPIYVENRPPYRVYRRERGYRPSRSISGVSLVERALRGELGQDGGDGSGIDLSNLPISPSSDFQPLIDPGSLIQPSPTADPLPFSDWIENLPIGPGSSELAMPLTMPAPPLQYAPPTIAPPIGPYGPSPTASCGVWCELGNMAKGFLQNFSVVPGMQKRNVATAPSGGSWGAAAGGGYAPSPRVAAPPIIPGVSNTMLFVGAGLLLVLLMRK
jgi:hypothetical protein